MFSNGKNWKATLQSEDTLWNKDTTSGPKTAGLIANFTLKWGHLWIHDTGIGSSQKYPYFTGLTATVERSRKQYLIT
jgi:hypothetical protein